MTELAGRLTERVRFEQRDGVRGPGGEPGDLWTMVWEGAAVVEPEGRAGSALGGERWQPGRRWRVTVRAGPTLALDMRMAWRGLTLRVAGTEVDPGARGQQTLWVEDG